MSARRWQNSKRARSLTSETIERMNLGDIRRKIVNQLSHGQRQWVELGMVVAAEPWLVLLDEPAAGMTHEETARTAELIKEINTQAALIVVEHDMQFIRMISQQVTVFHEGQILMEDTMEAYIKRQTRPRSLFGEPRMSALLKVKGLMAGYGKVPVLHGINLEVGEGEILGVLGTQRHGENHAAENPDGDYTCDRRPGQSLTVKT
jgi:ABC-type branched-subunit amino acid transport system ATPase component